MGLDYNQIYGALRQIVQPGHVFEVRCLGPRRNQATSGYFDDPSIAAAAIVDADDFWSGVYVTPNPVMRDAAARSHNRLTPWAQHTTHDTEITRRRWLLIDIDAKRLKGVSSNDAEHNAALAKANTIATTLSMMHGWPRPMMMDSGNGAWLYYAIDEENSEEVRDEIHLFLRILKAQFDDAQCDIDVTVYNAARIARLPGTWTRKGDSTPERPHRVARILQSADPFGRVSFLQVLRYNGLFKDAVQVSGQGGRSGGTGTGINRQEYPSDEALYKRLNEYAMRSVKEWVPKFFPAAREYKEGYRVASQDIGEQYEEDLTIHPWPLGIKYFGVSDQGDSTAGRRTPVGIIAQYSTRTDKATAARMLADHLKYPISEFEATPMAPPPPGPIGLSGGGGTGGGMGDLLGTKPRYNFKFIRSIADLQREEFREVKWVVKNVIPTGNMLLAARPKMRKTWLALQLSMAIASGRKFLDWECVQGDVLFLGLEDNKRRLQNRIRTLQKFELFPPDLSGFRYWTGGMDYDGSGRLKVMDPEEAAATLQAFPRGEAGVDAIEQYLEQFPRTTTVIIDTLAHFRGDRVSRDVYQSDYDSMTPITKLAARKGVLIIPVHHEKKGNADRGAGGDFLEDVSGSAGITGGSDGVISIKGRRGTQDENESRKLLVSGRDVPHDYEVDISFDAERGGWLKAAREDIKVSVRTLLARNPFLTQVDLRSLLPNAGQSRLQRCLTEMTMDGELDRGRFGYSLSKRV